MTQMKAKRTRTVIFLFVFKQLMAELKLPFILQRASKEKHCPELIPCWQLPDMIFGASNCNQDWSNKYRLLKDCFRRQTVQFSKKFYAFDRAKTRNSNQNRSSIKYSFKYCQLSNAFSKQKRQFWNKRLILDFTNQSCRSMYRNSCKETSKKNLTKQLAVQ